MAAILLASALMPSLVWAAPASLASSIAEKQAQAADAQVQLEAMRVDLGNQLAELAKINAQVDAARQDIVASNNKLAELDASAQMRLEQLGSRAVQMYKSGGLSTLEVVLGSKSISDLVSRISFLVDMQERDTLVLADVRKTRAEIAYLKGQQEAQAQTLSDLQRQADAGRVQIETSMAKQQAYMKSLNSEIATLVRQQEAAKAAAAAASAAAASAAAAANGGANGPFIPATVISDS
ncbi:MAG: hypothetical protein HGA39_08475, partial [Coriobacteriia bacterium]|nr:hypothetical protein [Coriobacteriia bacterium]